MSACNDTIDSKAEYYARKTYSDVDRIIVVNVDTVTYGDNLNYRISQANHDIEFCKGLIKQEKSYIEEIQRYGATHDTSDLHKYNQKLVSEIAWRNALDSLRISSSAILLEPTAFNCIIAYNGSSNYIWVQLDKEGNLQNITKDVNKVLLNPGDDIPGYLEIYQKYH